ncbi:MAG TPA: DUF3761 domain-containing protein [Pseudonocardiaceae bacterium]
MRDRLPFVIRLFAAALLGGAVLAGCGTLPNTTVDTPATVDTPGSVISVPPAPIISVPAPPTESEPVAPAAPAVPVVTAPPANDQANCGGDYYVNSDGNCVHRPELAPAAPAGATAKCADGTYSFSQHRSGTCSHHGGVAEWL